MKRVFQTLIFLFLFYYLFQIVYNIFNKGYDLTYTRNFEDKTVDIKEVYNSNQKNERDNYYLEMTVDDKVFYFKTYNNLKKAKNIVSDVKYFKNDEYTCLLPVFKNKQLFTDMLCQDDNKTTYYHNIKGLNDELDEFVNALDIYKSEQFEDTEVETSKLENIFVYKDNIESNLYLGLTNYRGLYNINDKVSKHIIPIDIFYNDVYEPKISTQVNNYYLVADYNQKYEFNKFYLINLLKKETIEIPTENKISFNSFIEGVVDDSAYLIDIDNKKQYEINVKDKTITETGNADGPTKFYNMGNWEERTIHEVIKNQDKFNNSNVDASLFSEDYYKIDQIGSSKSGYYYLYKKNETDYSIYKAYVEQPNHPTFLFNVTDIEKIRYINDKIIFIDKKFIKIYSDDAGIKSLIQYDELGFNKNINFYAYYQK